MSTVRPGRQNILQPYSGAEIWQRYVSHGCDTKGVAEPLPWEHVRSTENHDMATRERRLAEFNGNGEPPPDQPVQVLCEDHSGTYQLPFPCRWVDGEWRNSESGSTVEATVVGWRLPRF